MLAYLLLAPGQTALRDRLTGLFWGDRGEAQARASLRQCLHHLKAALTSVGEASLIVTRETVTLAPGAFTCDALELVNELDGYAWDEATRFVNEMGADQLLEDVDLSGDFLDWVTVERARLDSAIATVLSAHIGRSEEAGDLVATKALAGAWLRRDPVNEIAIAALIRAEVAGGAVVAAHRLYAAYQARLADELGVRPGPLVEAAINAARSGVDASPMSQPLATTPVVSTPEPPTTTSLPRDIVLAVLAFENLSSDEELSFFCDGVSEEIQCTVARGADVKVVARASSFQFRGKAWAIHDVAAALGSTHLLYGSVRRSGGRVRISAELTDCQQGDVLWSDRFDGRLDDVFALQEQVGEQVARALKIVLAPAAPPPHLASGDYERFLRARGMLAEGDAHYDNSAADAVPLLEKVVRSVPEHAQAWEQLALARARMLRYRQFGNTAKVNQAARAAATDAAETALELNPNGAGALLALAMLEPWGNYHRREQLLRNALELAPRDPAVLADMSHFCWGVGRFHEALSYAEQACELNPLMPAARLAVAQMLMYIGDFEGSQRMHVEMRRRWPNNPGVLLSLIASIPFFNGWHLYADALAAIDDFDPSQARTMRNASYYNEAFRGRDPEAIMAMYNFSKSLLDRHGTLPVSNILGVAMVGMVDEAYDLADRASFDFVFEGGGSGPTIYWPGTILGRWSALIPSPRFVGLCARLGLCDYWADTEQWPECVEWAPYDFKAEVRRTVAAQITTIPHHPQVSSHA